MFRTDTKAIRSDAAQFSGHSGAIQGMRVKVEEVYDALTGMSGMGEVIRMLEEISEDMSGEISLLRNVGETLQKIAFCYRDSENEIIQNTDCIEAAAGFFTVSAESFSATHPTVQQSGRSMMTIRELIKLFY